MEQTYRSQSSNHSTTHQRLEKQVTKCFLVLFQNLERIDFEKSYDKNLWEIVEGYEKHSIQLPLEEEVFAILQLARSYPSKVKLCVVNQLAFSFDRLVPSIFILGNSCET